VHGARHTVPRSFTLCMHVVTSSSRMFTIGHGLYVRCACSRYTFDIRADDLDTVAAPIILQHAQGAVQCSFLADLPNPIATQPKTCPLERGSMCIYKACFARPPSVYPKTIFRLNLSCHSVQAFIRFRIGSLPWPCVTCRIGIIPRAHEVYRLCQTGI